MLLDKLKEVRRTKSEYKVLQDRFYGEFVKRYPYIMNKDMARMANDLQENLHYMLCASLKYKSIQIKLPATTANYGGKDDEPTYVLAQRGEKGLYYSGSHRGTPDIHYFDTEYYMKDNGDMWCKYVDTDYDTKKSTDKDHLAVKFTELLKGVHQPRVWPDKVNVFFKLLQEIMAYRKKFLAYTDAGRGSGYDKRFKIGGLSFQMLDQSMRIKTSSLGHDRNSYRETMHSFKRYNSAHDIVRMLDYDSHDDEKEFSVNVHYRLKLFINNYGEIRKKLEYEEAYKKKVWKNCTSMLDALRVHTVPFKVLGELQK